MQYFPDFPLNPVVPAYDAYKKIDFGSLPSLNLIFPASFTPIPASEAESKFPMAALIQFVNSIPSATQFVNLPDATLGSTGYGSLIYNNTTNNIQIYNFTNTTSVLTLTPGQQFALFLTDNTTQGGEWLPIQSGVGTSAAIAAPLAGSGLLAIENTLNVITNVSDQTSFPTEFSATTGFQMFNFKGFTGDTNTWTIPAIPSNYPGFTFFVKNSSTGILTLQPNIPDVQTIDSQGSVSLANNDSAYIVAKPNGDLLTVGLNQSFQGSVQISSDGIRVKDGTAAIPSYSFINDHSLGLFRNSNGNLAISSQGTQVVSFNGLGVNLDSGSFNSEGINILYLAGIYP